MSKGGVIDVSGGGLRRRRRRRGEGGRRLWLCYGAIILLYCLAFPCHYFLRVELFVVLVDSGGEGGGGGGGGWCGAMYVTMIFGNGGRERRGVCISLLLTGFRISE